MDLHAEVERALEEMEWGEVVTTLIGAVHELLNGATNPPSPPSTTPAPVSAGLEPNTQPQPADSQYGGYGDWIPLGADHYMSEERHPLMAAPTISDGPLHQGDIMQPGHLHCGAGACCQGQYLPYLWPVEDVLTAAGVGHPAALPQTAAAFSYPAPPPQPFTNVPEVKLAEGQSLRFVGVLNGQLLYEVIAGGDAPPVYAAPPQNTSNSKKRKRDSQRDDDRPYIKRPPNAFMLFLKEQRTHVEAEVAERGSAAWKSLTEEQQAKYFSQAKTERLLHSQQHPEWSTQDNYGKRRKTQRSKASRLDSLKTVSTSLTSPLALTQTQSPPTETQTQSTH
ncbi:hypothetical protein ABVT39_014206 [Epinephelus coioides]